MITYEDLKKANEAVTPVKIERYDKKSGKKISKDYVEVNQRIKAFRMVYPDGCIHTEMVDLREGVCIFKASVYGSGDKTTNTLLGTGHAYEIEGSSNINSTSYIENCETSAVGRALGMAGFGIDTSVASYEEVANAMAMQEPATKEQIAYIVNMCSEDQIRKLEEKYKVSAIDDLSKINATKIIVKLNERKAKEIEQ